MTNDTRKTITIEERIVEAHAEQHTAIEELNERLPRPEALSGTTYKIAPGGRYENATYVTVNDIVMNAGTKDEIVRPFEIFINSKSMEHFQWVAALTLIISAVLRKGGDISFLGHELQSVFDPAGGHWRPGGRYIPSLVAEIGTILDHHISQRADTRTSPPGAEIGANPGHHTGQQADAAQCTKCGSRTLRKLGGCLTCTSCGDSTCG